MKIYKDPFHVAKQIAISCMIGTLLLVCSISIGLQLFQDEIAQLFTTDPDVLVECRTIWTKLCIYIIFMYIFAITVGIARALGLQWRLAGILIRCLWCGVVPCVLVFAVYFQGGLRVEWTVLDIGYVGMVVWLLSTLATLDWEEAMAAHADRKTTTQFNGEDAATSKQSSFRTEPSNGSYDSTDCPSNSRQEGIRQPTEGSPLLG